MSDRTYGWWCVAAVVGGFILTGSPSGSVAGMLILIGAILKDK